MEYVIKRVILGGAILAEVAGSTEAQALQRARAIVLKYLGLGFRGITIE